MVVDVHVQKSGIEYCSKVKQQMLYSLAEEVTEVNHLKMNLFQVALWMD